MNKFYNGILAVGTILFLIIALVVASLFFTMSSYEISNGWPSLVGYIIGSIVSAAMSFVLLKISKYIDAHDDTIE